MPEEVIIPCWRRGRLWPTLAYFAAVTASSLRLYKSSHAAGHWIVALFAILIGVPVCRLCLKKRFVFSRQPKAVRRELLFLGIRLKNESLDSARFKWVRSRMGSFEPRDAIVELGMEHSYDALAVQTIKYAMGETPEVIATRGQIAEVLGVADRGHERLPPQRSMG
ncbi:hypothetical protein LMG27174_05234 [Paraburkholderia rhynchosiae]|uniref:Uncharacterized protein n=1 Tax=Paraburkholderia rhynchosiae TaxID=487049 RepID=A0A2N7WDL7_9BURK|nr:hypothetical protein C0Z16_24590 [Paraburkholderia rhynchosiae]CAB3724405.1 hypothetical protein LMG27174_05234 [Paraburkholderia rhynchosiae]